MGDEPGQAHGVDRHVALHPRRGRLRRPRRRVELRLVVQLDDLGGVEVARGLLGEAHHQHGADREVRREEDRQLRRAGGLVDLGRVPARSCRRRTARRRSSARRMFGDDGRRAREVDHRVRRRPRSRRARARPPRAPARAPRRPCPSRATAAGARSGGSSRRAGERGVTRSSAARKRSSFGPIPAAESRSGASSVAASSHDSFGLDGLDLGDRPGRARGSPSR